MRHAHTVEVWKCEGKVNEYICRGYVVTGLPEFFPDYSGEWHYDGTTGKCWCEGCWNLLQAEGQRSAKDALETKHKAARLGIT